MTHLVTPDLCHTLDWNPIAVASAQAAIAAVLAGFVFAGIIVVLSVRARHHKRESAMALKLLFTAFFGLAVTAYLLADLAGEQTCPRAETTEVLAGGSLGAFAVITIVALTWLVIAYQFDDHGVLRFLHALVYVSCAFVVLKLCTNSVAYVGHELPGRSNYLANLLLYVTGGASLIGGAIWMSRRPDRPARAEPTDEAVTPDKLVDLCVWTSLAYLAISSLATGVQEALPPKLWYPAPTAGAIYLAAFGSLVLPLAVLALAANAIGRTAPDPSSRRSAS